MVESTCELCAAPFVGRCKTKRFCSYACGNTAHVRRHRAARRTPPDVRSCISCGSLFQIVNANQFYCCRGCRPSVKVSSARKSAARHRRRPLRLRYCLDCGELFNYSRRSNALRCQDCTYTHNAYRRHEAEARRRQVYRLGDKSITWQALGDRDGWCCHLCGKSVPKIAGVAVQPMGATIDHLVPVARGGTHEWDNVALAHRICNMRRSDGGITQLRLVG